MVSLTQEETVRELGLRGYNVSERTLTFWRSEGIAPRLRREGNHRFYTEEDISEIEFLCARKDRAPQEVLFRHYLEGESFDIVRIELFSVEGRIKVVLHVKNDGTLVREIDEEEFSAFTRAYENH